jgi:hypothetical protein
MARYDTYGATDDQILEDLDSNFKGFNNRSRPDSLEPGMFQVANNVRFGLGGLAQKRNAVNVLAAPFTVDTNTALVLPFNLYVDDAATGTTESSGVLTFAGITTTTGTDASNGIINNTLVSVTGTINNVVGYVSGSNYIATRVSATEISINIPVTTTGAVSGTPTIGAPKLSNAQNTRVVGSNNFIDPSNDNEEYILLAGTANAVAVKISDGTSTTINYPGGHVINEDRATVIQAFDKVFIFEEGHVPMSWDLNFSNAFTKEESGTFTQPTIKASNHTTAAADGLVTVGTITNTGFGALTTGDEIVIVESNMTGLDVDAGYQVASATTTSVSFYAEVPEEAANKNVSIIGRVSGGAGFTHAPAPGDAIVHRNRLVVPYKFTVDAGDDSYTARDVTDELLISFPFNSEKFDTTYGTFVTAGGQNDSFVAAFSFAEDKLLVFNRKSISVITGVDSFNFQEARVQSLTKEVGCLAKDTIVQVGNQILFLSDNGVYGVSFQDLYNLRGNDIPLSAAIDNSMSGPKFSQAAKFSSAVYFDNRYYIAVPASILSTSNKIVLVYNFLNKAWESIDGYGNADFTIDKLIVAGKSDKRGVYAVNSQGGVHRLEASSTDTQDSTITEIGGSTELDNISTELRTRQYNLKTIDRKKWNNFEIVMGNMNSVGVDATSQVIFYTFNRDTESNVTNFTMPADNNEKGISFRGRIGNKRAYGLEATISNPVGRFELYQFKVAGALTFRSQNKAE